MGGPLEAEGSCLGALLGLLEKGDCDASVVEKGHRLLHLLCSDPRTSGALLSALRDRAAQGLPNHWLSQLGLLQARLSAAPPAAEAPLRHALAYHLRGLAVELHVAVGQGERRRQSAQALLGALLGEGGRPMARMLSLLPLGSRRAVRPPPPVLDAELLSRCALPADPGPLAAAGGHAPLDLDAVGEALRLKALAAPPADGAAARELLLDAIAWVDAWNAFATDGAAAAHLAQAWRQVLGVLLTACFPALSEDAPALVAALEGLAGSCLQAVEAARPTASMPLLEPVASAALGACAALRRLGAGGAAPRLLAGALRALLPQGARLASSEPFRGALYAAALHLLRLDAERCGAELAAFAGELSALCAADACSGDAVHAPLSMALLSEMLRALGPRARAAVEALYAKGHLLRMLGALSAPACEAQQVLLSLLLRVAAAEGGARMLYDLGLVGRLAACASLEGAPFQADGIAFDAAAQRQRDTEARAAYLLVLTPALRLLSAMLTALPRARGLRQQCLALLRAKESSVEHLVRGAERSVAGLDAAAELATLLAHLAGDAETMAAGLGRLGDKCVDHAYALAASIAADPMPSGAAGWWASVRPQAMEELVRQQRDAAPPLGLAEWRRPGAPRASYHWCEFDLDVLRASQRLLARLLSFLWRRDLQGNAEAPLRPPPLLKLLDAAAAMASLLDAASRAAPGAPGAPDAPDGLLWQLRYSAEAAAALAYRAAARRPAAERRDHQAAALRAAQALDAAGARHPELHRLARRIGDAFAFGA